MARFAQVALSWNLAHSEDVMLVDVLVRCRPLVPSDWLARYQPLALSYDMTRWSILVLSFELTRSYMRLLSSVSAHSTTFGALPNLGSLHTMVL